MVQSKHRLAKREASCDKFYHVPSSKLSGLRSLGGHFIAQFSLQNSGPIALNEPLFVGGEDRCAAVYLGRGEVSAAHCQILQTGSRTPQGSPPSDIPRVREEFITSFSVPSSPHGTPPWHVIQVLSLHRFLCLYLLCRPVSPSSQRLTTTRSSLYLVPRTFIYTITRRQRQGQGQRSWVLLSAPSYFPFVLGFSHH